MYCRTRGFPGLFLTALVLTSCGRSPASSTGDRVAVLRFENLSPDPTLSWAGRAFSEVVSAQLAAVPGARVITSPKLHAFDRVMGPRPIAAPGISTEATAARLAGATRIVYGDYTVRNGRLEATVTIEDAARIRTLRAFEVSAAGTGILRAADEIARRIDPNAKPYSTRSEAALSGYIRALESNNPASDEPVLLAAIQADPDFGPPYRILAQERLQKGDLQGASAALEQALERGDRIAPGERARLQVQAAELSRDPNARHAALLKLVEADPGEAAAWQALGESWFVRHEDRHAMEAFQKAAQLEPQDATVWNLFGYAAARAGDLAAGTAALRRYEQLAPGANPLDSLGDIHFLLGKLEEAGNFYSQAFQKDPNFFNQGDLLKASVARLFTGDLGAADQAANRYFEARAKAQDPILASRRAQWLWLTGRRKQAMSQMQAFADSMEKSENPQLRDAGSRADAELALWYLMTGDRTTASQLAAKAVRVGSPAARGNALVAAFLAQPPASSSEWTVRAEQAFGGPAQNNIRNFALSYALLVNSEFHPAYLLLKQTWDSGGAIADEGLPVMIAWTLLEDNRPQEAASYLKLNPLPNANGLTPYAAFYLPRIFYLRGVLAQKEGRTADAAAEFKKFLTFSGDLPLIWGEEKKAR